MLDVRPKCADSAVGTTYVLRATCNSTRIYTVPYSVFLFVCLFARLLSAYLPQPSQKGNHSRTASHRAFNANRRQSNRKAGR